MRPFSISLRAGGGDALGAGAAELGRDRTGAVGGATFQTCLPYSRRS
jgi:hypothetical protein